MAKHYILGVLAAFAPACVHAQDVKGQDNSEEGGLSEIVVTAQKRAENVQDIPVTISAFSQSDLVSAGASASQDLTFLTPGLTFARSSINAQPTIRGIGARNSSGGDEPNIATYFDGIYMPDQNTNLFDLANLERIEVLKGPQSTLYGRNATGGAINIVTRNPKINETSFDLGVSVGRFGYYKLNSFVSVPLAYDKAAVSVSGLMVGDDGYIHNVYLNSRQGKRTSKVVQGKLLITPSEKTDLLFNAFYAEGDDNVTFSGQAYQGNSRARTASNPTGIPLSVVLPQGKFETATQFVPFFKTSQFVGSAKLSTDLDWATLSAVLGYTKTSSHSKSDSDLSPLQVSTSEIQMEGDSNYGELVLTSNPGGALDWIVGITGFRSYGAQDPNTSSGAGASPVVTRTSSGQRALAFAGFAEATYSLAPNLYLTGGMRYSYERKRSFNRPWLTNVITRGEASFNDVSPRAVLRYEFSPNDNVYASYTQGFKSGVFNSITVAGTITPARPEKIHAFEVGAKTSPANWLRLNAAAYHYIYKDLQTTVVQIQTGGTQTSVLENAPKATINGFEATAEVSLAKGLRFTAGLSLLDTKINDFRNASINVPIYAGGLPAGNQNVISNITGNELVRAPAATFNLGFGYETNFAGGTLNANAQAFFSSRWFAELGNRYAQPAYENVNASIGWSSPGDTYRISVFGKNLTNNYAGVALLTTTIVDNFTPQKPRWFGVSLDLSL